MQQLMYTQPAVLDGDRLREELAAAGVGAAALAIEANGKLAVSVADNVSTTTVAQVVAAHTGAPSKAAVRVADGDDALNQLVALAGGPAAVRTKLKAVLAGTDMLTNAQVLRLLAALALSEIRNLSNT